MPIIQAKPLKNVVPKYVNDAKPGKKYGSIKLEDDSKYLYPASMNGQFQAGVAAKVDVHTENWKDGPVEIINFKEPTAGNGFSKPIERAATNARDQVHMTVVGLAKEYISRGDIPNDDKHITAVLNRCYRGYMNSELAGHKKQVASDMNDEIPESEWQINSENPAD